MACDILFSLIGDVSVPQAFKVGEGLYDWSEQGELEGHQHWQFVLDQLLAAQSELIGDPLHTGDGQLTTFLALRAGLVL